MSGIETGSSQAAMFAAAPRPQVPRVGPRSGAPLNDRQVALAREKIGQFVGSTFFGLMLKELRKTTRNDHLLFGGRGEQTLQPLMDQALIEKLAGSRNFELADAIFDRLFANTSYSRIVTADQLGVVLSEERQ